MVLVVILSRSLRDARIGGRSCEDLESGVGRQYEENATAMSWPVASRLGSIRIAPRIRQQVVAPMAAIHKCMSETIRISPSMATSRTSPSPPKKLAVVSVFSVLVRSAW